MPDDGREPACMLMVDTEGYWEGDPISQSIYDVFVSGSVSVACMCLNEDEFHSEAIREQLADQLLVECNRLSALFEFDWDECQEDRDSGIWLDFVSSLSCSGAHVDSIVRRQDLRLHRPLRLLQPAAQWHVSGQKCNDDEYGNDDVDADSGTDSGSKTGIISTPGAFITCASTTCSRWRSSPTRSRMRWACVMATRSSRSMAW